MNKKITIVECPRDAMQGWPHMIPTVKKIHYLNELLKVGFDVLDFGSFVSPKAIPQMADTKEVLRGLSTESSTKLLAIVANKRGAEDAIAYEQISYLGFPLSVSETFQQRNTNSSIEESLKTVEEIHGLCVLNGKELVVYLSMGFGNPYGDEYSPAIVVEWLDKLVAMGIRIISVADTVGLATPDEVESLMTTIIPAYPGIECGVHLHSSPFDRKEKIEAALRAGCIRFDGAIKGIGGCPMAGNDLVGNMDTETMISYFKESGYHTNVNEQALSHCSQFASEIFI